MIVRPAGDVLQLITQPDHAALARRIMDRWQPPPLPPPARRASVFHAIAAHDDGWMELDDPLVLDTAGRIADFMTAPAADRRAVWPRAVAKLAADPWAAALVAQHAIHIYAHMREDPDWVPFFEQMEQLRTVWVQVAGEDAETLLDDYRLVRLGDLVSLVFCNRWTNQRDAYGFSIWWDGSRVAVTPDPFARSAVAIDVPARELPNRTFRDAHDAASAWRDAARVVVSGEIVGA